MTDPCAPHIHSQATLKAWRVWRLAHPGWKAKAVAVACGGAAIGGLPFVFYPPPAAVPIPPAPPVWVGEGPGPYCCGGSAGQGYVPPPEGTEFSPYLPLPAADERQTIVTTTAPPWVGGSPSAGPAQTPVEAWLPAAPPGSVAPMPEQVAVPEPSSFVLLLGAAGLAVWVGRR